MIQLSWVAKQYASDLFVCVALMYGGLLIMSNEAEKPSKLLGMSLLGGLLLFFTFPGVLVAFTLAAVISGKWLIERRPGWAHRILALGLPLGICAGVTSAIALQTRSPDTASYMSEYWTAGFPPSVIDTPAWLWRQLSGIYEAAFFTPYPRTGVEAVWPAVLLALCLLGVIALGSKRLMNALFLLAPVAAAVLAAMVHFYPLAERLSIFLTPSLVLLTVAGISALGTTAGRLFKPIAPVIYVACLVPTGLALYGSHPPFLMEHTRPLLEEVAAEWHPTDALYSYYAANHAVDYYGDRFGIMEWQAGICQRGNPRAYLEQLDAFRGLPRVWIVFTHVLPFLYSESDVILDYLRTIGTEQKAFLGYLDLTMTSAYLFDLSDQTRLRLATSADYASVSDVLLPTRNICGRGPASEWERP
jgi:hypothetical protein